MLTLENTQAPLQYLTEEMAYSARRRFCQFLLYNFSNSRCYWILISFLATYIIIVIETLLAIFKGGHPL